MKTKIIPFDLEIAKDIQAGKIEGRILCANGVRARVVEFNMVGSTDIVVVRGTLESGIEWCYPYKKDGCFIDGYLNGSTGYDLIIELPEETPKLDDITTREGFHNAFSKHEFKPFDKVLVRNSNSSIWVPRLYSYRRNGAHYAQDGIQYQQVIPYEGNEHLVGTTVNPIPREE